jgi:hypothetical protein
MLTLVPILGGKSGLFLHKGVFFQGSNGTCLKTHHLDLGNL